MRLPQVKGEYFIDRDGEFFGPILTYLRSGELRVPTGARLLTSSPSAHVSGMSKADILREAKFFLIGSLVELLEQQAAQSAERAHEEELTRRYRPPPGFDRR